jgi:hypothetical protein
MTNTSKLEQNNESTLKKDKKVELGDSSYEQSQINKKDEPPSFYLEDQHKWKQKFEKSTKERQMEKKMIDLQLNGAQPTYGIESKSKIA